VSVEREDEVATKATLAWATLGVLSILGEAAIRLALIAFEGLHGQPRPGVVLGYLVAIAVMVYVEGYRGFHKSFAPAFAARATELARSGSFGCRLAAPIVAMGLCGCDRKTHLRMWTLTAFIVGFVFLVRAAEQPVRGMIDAGVSVALLVGGISVAWHVLRGRVVDEEVAR
jgi:hypothetical protein